MKRSVHESLQKYYEIIGQSDLRSHEGKVSKIIGMTLEATGLQCSIGDLCTIHIDKNQTEVISEVVGIAENKVLLMPFQEIHGLGYGCAVTTKGEKLTIQVSEALIGRTIDPLGRPIDGGAKLPGGKFIPIIRNPENPMDRTPITSAMELGVKAIDGLLTIGKGQRIGIFAGSGVGKSTLMGMIARNVRADVNVIALVGERGREVLEFLERDLGPEGLKRSVLVVATSDQPALMRLKCAHTATAIAEYFKDRGLDVLLMMDSLTRFAMAQREIGLSTGEAPVARGYTPSIYYELPKLLERSGNFKSGSITGIYTVLVEGDDTNEPIADTARSILDGHIVLSRKIASKNHYPAIDVLSSISRLMSGIVGSEQKAASNRLRSILAVYRENEDLISIGAYKPGNNPDLDDALAHMKKVDDFLIQKVDEASGFGETQKLLIESVR